MFKTRKGLLIILLLLCFSGGFGQKVIYDYFSKDSVPQVRVVNISTKRETHILYGDKSGGGHFFGVGKPCKSEFPKDWDKSDILQTVKILATNDNLNWKQQKNGYYVAEDTIDGLRIRVVLDEEKDDVITAYPVNVSRNPCPTQKPANDNFNE